MNGIGDQNYCGLALRGNRVLDEHDSFGWNGNALEFGQVPLKKLVNITARRLRRAFHIHSERIFAAGCGTGADVALRLFSECPEWFAGAVAIDPTCQERPVLGSAGDLRGKPVLQTVSRTSSNETLAMNVDAVRLLRTAGVEVDVRITEEPLDPCSNDARFIDSWLLSKLRCETYV
jgi:phospholipase/carboxylesterase